MIRVDKGVRPEDVRQNGRHVLFVEGRGNDSLDPQIVGELFDGILRIEPLGASFNVKSVAEALQPFHPSYYFLIDRDHYDDGYVDRCWDNFPDPQTHNLLIWKYREIENYFLEPDYLASSDFLKVEKDVLEKKIKQFARERLYLDTANHVIVSIRETLKRTWIKKFTNPTGFETREAAIKNLQAAQEFEQFKKNVEHRIDPNEVERSFDHYLHQMTGGTVPLEFGTGKWLQMIQGKKVFSRVVHSECFQVIDLEGNQLQGQEKVNWVVKNLLRKDISKQPEDFRRLKQLIENRVYS